MKLIYAVEVDTFYKHVRVEGVGEGASGIFVSMDEALLSVKNHASEQLNHESERLEATKNLF